MHLVRGEQKLKFFLNNEWPMIKHEVLSIPSMKRNLFSVKYVAKKGYRFQHNDNGKLCVFSCDEKVIATGSDIGNLYKINICVLGPVCDLSIIQANIAEKQVRCNYERLYHQNIWHEKDFLKNQNIKFKRNDFFCEECVYGKQHCLCFHKKVDRAIKPHEIIYTDLCGPMEVESLGKKRYMFIFKDYFSKRNFFINLIYF